MPDTRPGYLAQCHLLALPVTSLFHQALVTMLLAVSLTYMKKYVPFLPDSQLMPVTYLPLSHPALNIYNSDTPY